MRWRDSSLPLDYQQETPGSLSDAEIKFFREFEYETTLREKNRRS